MAGMKELYQKVAQDVALQEKFNQILAEAEGAGQTATEEKLKAFAKEAGHEISIEEMQAFFEGMAAQAEGELSDGELDQVAGGKTYKGAFMIFFSVTSFGVLCATVSVILELDSGACAEAFDK